MEEEETCQFFICYYNWVILGQSLFLSWIYLTGLLWDTEWVWKKTHYAALSNFHRKDGENGNKYINKFLHPTKHNQKLSIHVSFLPLEMSLSDYGEMKSSEVCEDSSAEIFILFYTPLYLSYRLRAVYSNFVNILGLGVQSDLRQI